MIVVLPLLGCGSQEALFDDGAPRRDARLATVAPSANPPRPVLASSGSAYAYAASGGTKANTQIAEVKSQVLEAKSEVVEAYATLPTGGVQRTSLAPLAEPVKPVAQAAAEPASYAMGAVQYGAPRGADAKAGLVREAANYSRKQPASSPRQESDYEEADEARRTDYAPEPRARKAEPQEAGVYVVQPGDSLYAIAERNGLSLDELTALNALAKQEIHPGQRLRVQGQPGGYQGKAYREARPEPQPYREPVQERGASYRQPAQERGPSSRQPIEEREAPYRAQNEPARGAYRNAPAAANVYEQQRPEPRYEEAERYQQSRSYRSPYQDERPAREPAGAYREPRGDDGRPEYTGSSNKYTPDGPFEPTPDAPWRGESEWRRMNQRAEPQRSYEPQREPRYESRRPAQPEAYDARPPFQAQPAERAPYAGRPPRETERETYAAPPRGGRAEGAYAYTVQRGDTLYEIARRNGVDQRELAAFNGLSPETRLVAGQDLRIPQGRGYAAPGGRPEASVQPAPARQRPPVQGERAQAPVKAAIATPEPVKPAHQGQAKRSSKIITDQLPQRPQAKPTAELVEEDVPPAKAAPSRESHLQRRAAAPEAAPEPAVDVAVNEPAATASSSATATAHAAAPRECEALLASPEPRSAKTFRTPVQGMVIAKFGSQNDGSFNDGINFSVPKGTAVKAAENGVVAYAGDELPGFGNLVLVRHSDGYVSAYAHNDELLVRKCDVVKRGQIISKAGASGKATSPQLHFELRKDSKPMDPEGHFSGT